MTLDTAHLAQFSDTLAHELDALQQSIQGHAGVPFNVDSPKQLGDVLFEHLEIPAKVKKTKTGQYPTSEAVLSKLKDKHPIVGEVLEYRKLKKLRSTYVEPLPSLLHPETGRVHTTYMQVVAATGRLSSKDPNLQNIPIRTAQGREIRKAFVPRSANHVLVAADYSQVELRIAAAMSEEQGLIEAFQKGEDIHAATAAKVFGVPLDEVTCDQRSQAKAVNFGILYGQGAFGLAGELGHFAERSQAASSTPTTRNSLASKPSPKPAWPRHEKEGTRPRCWDVDALCPTSTATTPWFGRLPNETPSTPPFKALQRTSSKWP